MLHIHGRVLLYLLIIAVVPALLRREKFPPLIGIFAAPGGYGFMVLKGRIIISPSLEFLQRLINKEPKIIHALVDMAVESGIRSVLQHVPRHACGSPVQKRIKLRNALHRVGVAVRIDCLCLCDGFFHEGHQLRIGFQASHHGDGRF